MAKKISTADYNIFIVALYNESVEIDIKKRILGYLEREDELSLKILGRFEEFELEEMNKLANELRDRDIALCPNCMEHDLKVISVTNRYYGSL